jgi:asparagine synthase (glutamine-hydrolysing)
MEIAFDISAGMNSLLIDRFLAENNGHEGFRSFFNDLDVPGQLAGRHQLHQSRYLWSKTRLSDYLLTVLGDRMKWPHSVEGRLPFLDHPLVECAHLPVTRRFAARLTKYVLRHSMRSLITPTVFRRPKRPLWSRRVTQPQGRFRPEQNVLRGPILRSIPFFDQGGSFKC